MISGGLAKQRVPPMRCRFRNQPKGRSMKSGSYDRVGQEQRDGRHGGATGADAAGMTLYTASRTEVMAGEFEGVRTVVEHHLVRIPAAARRSFQSLMFHIHGYD